MDALSSGAVACMRVLLGEAPNAITPGPPNPLAIETVNRVIAVQSRYWPSLCYSYGDPEFDGKRQNSLSSLVALHWSTMVEESGSIFRVPMSLLQLQRFERRIHLSQSALSSPNKLFVFVHGDGFARTTDSALVSNCLGSMHTKIYLPYMDYIQEAQAFGASVLDVMFTADELARAVKQTSSGAVTCSGASSALVDQILRHVWDRILPVCSSKSVVLLAADDACYAILKLFDTIADLQENFLLEAIAMLYPRPSACPLPRQHALWLCDRSILAIPNTAPIGTRLEWGRIFGNVVSTGTTFPCDYPATIDKFRTLVGLFSFTFVGV